MGRRVSAVVTSGTRHLGVIGPFDVDTPWWADVGPVVARLRELLGVPAYVLRLLSVEGGAGARDGHVTYHVAAGSLEPDPLPSHALRVPWARAENLGELLDWAVATVGRTVTGPIEQHRTWNLAGLFRLPTAEGPVWLKATPRFAADEAAVIAAFARVDPDLVPTVVAAGDHRILLEHLPGQDCWDAPDEVLTSGVRRFVAAQAAVVAPAGLADRRPATIANRAAELLDRLGDELTTEERSGATALISSTLDFDLPTTLVHGDFHAGNWRSTGDEPVILDFADAHLGSPVLDGLRLCDFLPESRRPAARQAWVSAWRAVYPDSDPARALAAAEPYAHLSYAVRYQEFLDGIEPSERIYHEGDPASEIRAALRSARR